MTILLTPSIDIASQKQRAGEAAVSASRRLRVLALGPQDVWPATDGGKEGIHGAVEALSRLVDLTYACPAKPADAATQAHFEAIGVRYCPVGYEPRDTPGVVVGATLRGRPFKFHKYGTTEAARLFDAAIGPMAPDVLLCFHAHTEELGRRLAQLRGWNLPLLVREHNIEYQLVSSYRASLSWPGRMAGWLFEQLTRREEQRIWQTADATAFLSDRDFATACQEGRGGRLILAPEGVPLPPRRAQDHANAQKQLLIPLNKRATQSVANLKDFLNGYWAVIANDPRLQGIRLAVTGVDAATLAQLTGFDLSAQQRTRVLALGFLPSLAPAFAASLALISPTFVGGGIRKKVLEGMANQLPVIATALDIDTCSFFNPPDNILPLTTPQALVDTIERLRTDVAFWNKLSDAGRATVEEHASWDSFAAILVDEMRRLLAQRGVSQ